MVNTETVLPFSQACENNKRPILSVLSRYLKRPQRVLEVGSGTAQHAVYFAQEMPHLTWQPTEIMGGLSKTQQRLSQSLSLANLSPLKPLDVTQPRWPVGFDAVFTANTLHIMSWACVECFIAQVSQGLPIGGFCFMYGPFNYGGTFTSESNEAFNQFLQQLDASSGIRHFEQIEKLFHERNVHLVEDAEMPANNRMLVWGKE